MNNMRDQLLKAGLVSQEKYDQAEKEEANRTQAAEKKSAKVRRIVRDATSTQEVRSELESLGTNKAAISEATEQWKRKSLPS